MHDFFASLQLGHSAGTQFASIFLWISPRMNRKIDSRANSWSHVERFKTSPVRILYRMSSVSKRQREGIVFDHLAWEGGYTLVRKGPAQTWRPILFTSFSCKNSTQPFTIWTRGMGFVGRSLLCCIINRRRRPRFRGLAAFSLTGRKRKESTGILPSGENIFSPVRRLLTAVCNKLCCLEGAVYAAILLCFRSSLLMTACGYALCFRAGFRWERGCWIW